MFHSRYEYCILYTINKLVGKLTRSLRLLVHFPRYKPHECSAICTFPSICKHTTDILLYIGSSILLTYPIGTKTSKTASYLILHSRSKGFFQLFTVSCAVITGCSFWSSLGFLVFLLSPGFYFWNPSATELVSTSWL